MRVSQKGSHEPLVIFETQRQVVRIFKAQPTLTCFVHDVGKQLQEQKVNSLCTELAGRQQ